MSRWQVDRHTRRLSQCTHGQLGGQRVSGVGLLRGRLGQLQSVLGKYLYLVHTPRAASMGPPTLCGKELIVIDGDISVSDQTFW